MGRELTVSGSVDLDGVTPEAAYAAVSDVTQMGRWSPENLGAQVPSPRDAAYVGMTFVGANKRGPVRWRTGCTVTVADPGERFEFRVHRYGLDAGPLLPVSVATWAYDFAPTPHGTRVTETWTDDRRRWPDAVAARFDRWATGGLLFADFQRKNIARTLTALKSELEA